MKTRIAVALAALFLAAGALSPARADSKDEAAIKAVYEQMKKAFLNGNAESLSSTCTADFTYKDTHGQVQHLKDMIAAMKAQFAAGFKISKIDDHFEKITVKGTTAVVAGSGVMEGSLKGPDGKVHKIASHSKGTDTLVKTAKGWKFKTVVVAEEKQTLDGQPFDASGAPPQPKPGSGRK